MPRALWIPLVIAAVLGLWILVPDRSEDPLTDLDAEAALELANRWAFERPEVTSYLTARALVFQFPDGSERRIALPEDRMVVSVAPYLRYTHPCRVHFPSSCRGELAGETLYLRVVEEGGAVYFEGSVRLGRNGFYDLWLPRGRRFRLEAVYQGFRGTIPLVTGEEAVTCRTDLRLARF